MRCMTKRGYARRHNRENRSSAAVWPGRRAGHASRPTSCAADNPLRRRKSHVVGVERVWHDQPRLAVSRIPITQIVSIAVGIVDEAALLGDEPMRVGAAAAEISAERPLAGSATMNFDRAPEVLRFALGRSALA
jgi:hypothetical protein